MWGRSQGAFQTCSEYDTHAALQVHVLSEDHGFKSNKRAHESCRDLHVLVSGS